jgi:4-hydroxy-tetrahydrodipicolinate synthase
MTRPYRGVWPVAPTPFTETGDLDLDGQKRVLDLMVDQGVDGLCILANYSEQFLISDEERELLMRLCLEHVAGRVPVIVTCSHFSTRIVVERCRRAAELGAAMIMLMPPYHGATLKGSLEGTTEQFARAAEVGVPIMVQDAPLSGVDLPVPLLVRMAREIEALKLFKIECPQAAAKLRALIEAGGDAIEGPFDGEEAITLLADLDAGATGTMTSAMIPDLIGPIVSDFLAGRRDEAVAGYARVLPAVNHENRQCGFRAAKAAMVEGGVIGSEFCRHPIPPLHPSTRAMLIELLRPLDPLVLRWGR